jgi:predicted Zn finger-like uncharacterized protein
MPNSKVNHNRMMTSCPACAARFRLNQEKFGGQRITLKCVKCQKVFAVNVSPATALPVSGGVRVLVAHSDVSLCEMIGELLEKHGMTGQSCHEGTQALQLMQEQPPHVALVDVALPGLYAFEVVEKIRTRPGLADVKIILLSSVYNKMAYKRTPSSLYGADGYIEKHHIACDLIPRINQLATNAHPLDNSVLVSTREPVVAAQAVSTAEETADRAYSEELNDRIREAEAVETMPAMSGELLEKAHRLARNIVSDIALYNQDKVEAGIRNNAFYKVLQKEIEEGRRLFNERYSPKDCGGKDVLQLEFDAFITRRQAEQRR